MTSPERVHALIEAVRYVTRRRIPGAIVECGVWRGGSMMAAARTLLSLGSTDRDLYLFDTFEGMSAPSEADVDLAGDARTPCSATSSKSDASSYWCYASLEDVQAALAKVGYPAHRIHYVRGKVRRHGSGAGAGTDRAAPLGHGLVRIDAPRARAPVSASLVGRRADHRRLRPLEGIAEGDRRVHRVDARVRPAQPHRLHGRLAIKP